MRYQKLSPRQNLAMTWWNRPGFGDYDGIICDGSIRSGKTVAMTVGFIMWAMCRFQGQNFALCGKTIESLRRNVTTNLPTWLAGVFSFREYRTENKIVVSAAGRSNNFYLFGGRDESSASLIQGITLAGVLLDEVALMPRSFVEQACARCSVEGSKLWFNCNPEGPSHWFYLTWVLEAGKRNMLHLHFTMDDNLSLSAAVKARYESLYSGVFYDRFIRGLWVVAEGLIYTMFNKDYHVVPDVPRPYDRYYISVDYGTVNPTSMGLWGRASGKPVYVSVAHHGRDVLSRFHCEPAQENSERRRTAAHQISRSQTYLRHVGAAKWGGCQNGILDAGTLRRGLHPAHLHPRHAAKARRSRAGHGQLHGAGDVNAESDKSTGEEAELPLLCSFTLSAHFRVWVTVWVKTVPHRDPQIKLAKK